MTSYHKPKPDPKDTLTLHKLVYRYYKQGKTEIEGWMIVKQIFRSLGNYRLRQIIQEMKELEKQNKI